MKYKIVFSIPIHQKMEVVIDQIVNFRHFNKNCAIIFHISQGFDNNDTLISKDEFFEIIQKFEGVYINPTSVKTGLHSIIQAHISNFKYIKDVISFDYFAICASNESFVKEGLYEHILGTECGFKQCIINKPTEWTHGTNLFKDQPFLDYLRARAINRIIFTNAEGQYYRSELFLRIVNEIDSFFKLDEVKMAYPRDEIYCSTIAYHFCKKEKKKIGYLFTYSAYHFTHLWDVSKIEVDRLISGNGHFYTIKRVERQINDNIRSYLRNIFHYKMEEKKILSEYGCELLDYSNVRIYILDIYKYINAIVHNLPKIRQRIWKVVRI